MNKVFMPVLLIKFKSILIMWSRGTTIINRGRTEKPDE